MTPDFALGWLLGVAFAWVVLVPTRTAVRRRRGCQGCEYGALVDAHGGPCLWCGEDRRLSRRRAELEGADVVRAMRGRR